MRCASTPAIGATIIGIPVHGSVRRPASSGPYPCAVWKNWLSRKIAPKVPKNIANESPLVALNARERNIRIGSIGSRARNSQRTNAASSRTPGRAPRPRWRSSSRATRRG